MTWRFSSGRCRTDGYHAGDRIVGLFDHTAYGASVAQLPWKPYGTHRQVDRGHRIAGEVLGVQHQEIACLSLGVIHKAENEAVVLSRPLRSLVRRLPLRHRLGGFWSHWRPWSGRA